MEGQRERLLRRGDYIRGSFIKPERVDGYVVGVNPGDRTDVLGRFDESSFLFFLPNTGPDGARVMAERIKAIANDRGLSDLVGDPLQIAAGISFFPHVDVQRREDLFGRAREAFLAARAEGTGLITAG